MDNSRHAPPLFPNWILKRFLSPYVETALVGDLEEEFYFVCSESGHQKARNWYFWQVLKSLPLAFRLLVYWSVEMIKNYLKIAYRNIFRHKGYSFINITGLAVGMACCVLILLWVQDELSFDRFHENAEDIYLVYQDIKFTDHQTKWAITQGPLAPSLKADFPEIINATRITWRGLRLNYNDQSFDETLGMADGSILEMFTFPLIKGDPKTALEDPHSIILSAEMAEKYFKNEDPIGRTITADNTYDFKVTGVMENIPHNSHLQFDFLIPFIFGRELNYTVDSWGNSSFRTFVQVPKNMDSKQVTAKISAYLDEKPTIEKNAKLNLHPLTQIHLHSHFEFDMYHGDITYVTIFSLVAFFILFIACINFMNLTTARSANRSREVGMRKVAGAYRSDIIRQFFGESILMAWAAMVLALGLVWLLLPTFNNLAEKELSLRIFENPQISLGLIAIAVMTGIISGSYPALFLSSFHPAKVLKGGLSFSAKGSNFRKILVVIQFSLTILLITCTVFIYNQLNYMRNQKLGFDKEYMIYMGMRGDMRKSFDAFKNELLRNPDIIEVTAGASIPTSGYYFSNSKWRWDGQKPDEEILMRADFVDVNFFETFGMEILEGRSFSEGLPTEKNYSFIINEKAAQVMNMTTPVGNRLSIGEDQGTIIGVVKNYHFRSLHEEIEPLILIYEPNYCDIIFAKLKAKEISQTLGHVESVWKKFSPEYPFGYRFLDEALDRLYRAEQQTGKIFSYFASLAILISCLGLFGLASFMAEQRTKEIGVRKILGASVSNIVLMLSRDFTKWVLIANLIAWPAAYFAAYKWLQGYAYRINITFVPFVISAVLALFIALLTVSYKSFRSARAYPADSLRHE
jgi:ABC-type antimicrobial peptide transport system permease subunit